MSNSTTIPTELELIQRIAALERNLTALGQGLAVNDASLYTVMASIIIYLMQTGFAFLEAGAVRSKNTTNILFKNLLDSCVAVIGYWSIGWALAFGNGNDTFCLFFGHTQFFLIDFNDYTRFFFQFVFAATAATIVSGAVAERIKFITYMAYTAAISSVIYPIITHWAWHPQGWLAQGITVSGKGISFIDFAGSGCVHACGGAISLLAAWIVGPRIGRFSGPGGNPPAQDLKGHSVPFAALGGFILMFGFLAFNGGAMADNLKPGEGIKVALALTNTMIGGATALLSSLAFYYTESKKLSLLVPLNACLAGMVSLCAGCNQLEPWAAAITGICASALYHALAKLAVALKIDDPLEAFAVHFGGGATGILTVAIVKPDGIVYSLVRLFGNGTWSDVGVAGMCFVWQLIGLTAIFIFSIVSIAPVFWALKKTGRLRVPVEMETKGIDIYIHGEAAYPLCAYGHGWDDYESVNAQSTRKISAQVELSLEELAKAYERGTSFDVPPVDRRTSVQRRAAAGHHPQSPQQIASNGRSPQGGKVYAARDPNSNHI